MKRALVNGGVVVASLIVALVLTELVARMFLNPADFLSVTTVRDDVLGIRIAPHTAGFDAWGFRNSGVPSRADIVAIGDSHTYGNNATMAESWPAVVGRLTGHSVYNLALGGYGPNQYYHLMTTRALSLKPRWVICGLYLGDDFENAFLMTYGREHWSSLRNGQWDRVQADIWESPEPGGGLRALRRWLSRNSVVYRLVVHGPVLGRVKAALQIRQADRSDSKVVTSLTVPDAGIHEAFRPIGMRDRLNQRSPAVREGMRITFELLAKMNQTCRDHGCRLLVVLIPTKETVFAEYLLRDPQVRLRDVIAQLVDDEAEARRELQAFLARADIPYVDTLLALRRRVGEHLYTRSDGDMHPDAKGYGVIGEAVAEFLRRHHEASIFDIGYAVGTAGRQTAAIVTDLGRES